MEVYTAVREYTSLQSNQLELQAGMAVQVIHKHPSGWWDGVVAGPSGPVRGWFPSTYVQQLGAGTPPPVASSTLPELRPPFALRSNLLLDELLLNAGLSTSSAPVPRMPLVETGAPLGLSPDVHSRLFQGRRGAGLILGLARLNTSINTDPTTALSMMLGVHLLAQMPVIPAEEAERRLKEMNLTKPLPWLVCTLGDGRTLYYNDLLDACVSLVPWVEQPEVTAETEYEFHFNDIHWQRLDLTAASLTALLMLALHKGLVLTTSSNGSSDIQPPPQLEPTSGTGTGSGSSTGSDGPASSDNKDGLTLPIHLKRVVPRTDATTLHQEPGIFHALPGDVRTLNQYRHEFRTTCRLIQEAMHRRSKHLLDIHATRLLVLAEMLSRVVEIWQEGEGPALGVHRLRLLEWRAQVDRSVRRIAINGALYVQMDVMLELWPRGDVESYFSGPSLGAINKTSAKYGSASTMPYDGEPGLPVAQRHLLVVTVGSEQRHLLVATVAMDLAGPDGVGAGRPLIATGVLQSLLLSTALQADQYLEAVKTDVERAQRAVGLIVETLSPVYLVLPQVYPRFLQDSMEGGLWLNPLFIKPKSDVFALFNHRRNGALRPGRTRRFRSSLFDRDTKERLERIGQRLRGDLAEVRLWMDPSNGSDPTRKEQRNLRVFALVYKLLEHSTRIMQLLEGLDFTVFNMAHNVSWMTDDVVEDGVEAPMPGAPLDRDDPGAATAPPLVFSGVSDQVRAFFAAKQRLHVAMAMCVMLAQELGAEDARVFQLPLRDEPVAKDGRRTQVDLLAQKFRTWFQHTETGEWHQGLAPSRRNTHASVFGSGLRLGLRDGTKASDFLGDSEALFLQSIDQLLQELSLVQETFRMLLVERDRILTQATLMMSSEFDFEIMQSNAGLRLFGPLSGSGAGLDDEDDDEEDEYDGRYAYGGSLEEESSSASSEDSLYREDSAFLALDGQTRHAPGNRRLRRQVPWYLQDEGDVLRFLYDRKGQVKGGTVRQLVARLTHQDGVDPQFRAIFFTTFRLFLTMGELLDALVARFQLAAPEGLLYVEYRQWTDQRKVPIMVRVLRSMEEWLKLYWWPQNVDEEALERWLEFAKGALRQFPQEVQQQQAELVLTVISGVETALAGGTICERRAVVCSSGDKLIAPIMARVRKRPALLDIDFLEFARQLTLKEFGLYHAIRRLEIVAKGWGKKYGFTDGLREWYQNITLFINNLNALTAFVLAAILEKGDVRKRVMRIRYFVQVAETCRKYNNFLLMTAIISGLLLLPIHRLKHTWKKVPPNVEAVLSRMNKLMNLVRNFNEYRDMLKFVANEPCVPFYGVYLSDITFTSQGNPDFLGDLKPPALGSPLDDTRIVNFSKRTRTYEVVQAQERFKYLLYGFMAVPEVQQFIDTAFALAPPMDQLYQKLLEVEPRDMALPKLAKEKSLRQAVPQTILQGTSRVLAKMQDKGVRTLYTGV